ncbi:ATP phosphoribosyltransferase regulatory subunit [Selenomonas sp. TAMA-11512]|uniref:ATP phosphoribosyltransferase regulatory subunit n=1 Tax=Selenomonas sp. TAMA-11512 TaxID=3095337 RepID=UPI0030857641|nr:ATP phosphoribosyltransferase regulatory subunit [Selenomonas sp. TAMA-11512]
MQKREQLFEIPYGTRDFLPEDAVEMRHLESTAAALFHQWGYDEVKTPAFEYLDTLTRANGASLESSLFKLVDRDNRMIALRHEMTSPIARLVSSRMKRDNLPLKLSYISDVFRFEDAQSGRQCAFHQAGVELLGSSSSAADAEVIALAIESLKAMGLEDFQVSLGQADFINGLLRQMNLSAEQQSSAKSALERHDLVALEQLSEEAALSPANREALTELSGLHGKEEILDRAYQLSFNEQSRRAVDNLSEIYRLLKVYGVEGYVYFDFGVTRDLSYYTGMVFEVYALGLGYPICGGGRYDDMFESFHHPCPATGFALGLERVLAAKKQQGFAYSAADRHDFYISFTASKLSAALQKAKELRASGYSVFLSLQAESEEEARQSARAHACKELVYCS